MVDQHLADLCLGHFLTKFDQFKIGVTVLSEDLDPLNEVLCEPTLTVPFGSLEVPATEKVLFVAIIEFPSFGIVVFIIL